MRRYEGSFRPRSFAPVKIGDEVDVTIESVGEKGDGLARVKGFVIFVPGTKQGDTVKIRITKVLRKVAFGEVVGGAEPTEEAAEEAPEETGETEEPSEETGETEEPSEETGEESFEDTEEFG